MIKSNVSKDMFELLRKEVHSKFNTIMKDFEDRRKSLQQNSRKISDKDISLLVNEDVY